MRAHGALGRVSSSAPIQTVERTHIFREDSCVLHSQKASATQLSVLDIEVELAAALRLASVLPIHVLAAFRVERNWDDGAGCLPHATNISHMLASHRDMNASVACRLTA